jgi:hypothetical protein
VIQDERDSADPMVAQGGLVAAVYPRVVVVTVSHNPVIAFVIVTLGLFSNRYTVSLRDELVFVHIKAIHSRARPRSSSSLPSRRRLLIVLTTPKL